MDKIFFEPTTFRGIPKRYIIKNLHLLTDEEKQRKNIERGNHFMDKVIETIADYGFGNDAYPLEDMEFKFQRRIGCGNISLDTLLFDGQLKGLETLDRPGPCSFYDQDGRIHINAALTVGPLNLRYEGCFRLLSILSPHFTLEIDVFELTICLYVSVNSSNGQEGILHKLFIRNIKDFRVNFTGLRPFTKPINFLNKGLVKLFRNYIEEKLEKHVEDHIKSRIVNFSFPNKKVIYYRYKLQVPPHSQSPRRFSTLQTIEESE